MSDQAFTINQVSGINQASVPDSVLVTDQASVTDPASLAALASLSAEAAGMGKAPTADPAPTAPAPGRGLRGDIQGLRAIAVMMVLLYHAGVTFLPGGFAGVDVFFVISGFLITGLMVREVERTGRLSLRNFWARRAKRLLPATALVLVTVTALSLVVLPQVRWAGTAGDLIAAALYVINWRLASQSVDYLAQDYAPSPVQHFWSLAVEEQFYVFFPILVLLLGWVARRLGWPLRRILLVAVTLVAGGSLAWSVHLGAQPVAYFITTTRAWELGIGAAVAIGSVRLDRMNPWVARVITWIGVLGLVAVAFRLSDTVPWPGSAALMPTLATAAVIAGGPAAGRRGATALLGLAPMRWIGDLSYSLYLWHWPLLVFATLEWTKLTPLQGLGVVTASFLPAILTNRLVESPLHRSRMLSAFPIRALAVGAACTAVGVAAGLFLNVSIPAVKVVPPSQRLGAQAITGDPSRPVGPATVSSITPDPLTARNDLPDLYERHCQAGYSEPKPTMCQFGDQSSKVWVVLVGDSQASQWAPTLQPLADTEDWHLTTISKAGCPFADVEIVKGAPGHELPYTSCTQWNASVRKLLLNGPNRPDLVITSAYSPYLVKGTDAKTGEDKVLKGVASQQAMIKGLHATWALLNAAKIPVVALRESPHMSSDIPDCVSQHRDDLAQCATSRNSALRQAHTIQPAKAGLPLSTAVDLTLTGVCPMDMCPPVIGNVLIYRDEHHLTATYARTLTPFMAHALYRLLDKHWAKGAMDSILKPDAEPTPIPTPTPTPAPKSHKKAHKKSS